MRYHELFEAKFRKPNIMFHGTSTAFLPSILKHGMNPSPKEKSWDVDPDVSLYSQSRVSLEGSYWASNLLTATSSAWRTSNKYAGDELLIIAQIQQQQAFADEDSVTFTINNIFSISVGNSMYAERPDLMAQIYFDHPDIITKSKSEFERRLHNSFVKDKINGKKPIPTDMLSDVFDAYVMRIIAHGERDSNGKEWYSPLYRVTNKPESIPSVNDAETNLLKQKDRLTKYYNESAIEQPTSFNHTLRITEPVTYSGANKILFILERDKKLHNLPLKLHYGNPPLPTKFIDQWHRSIGAFPGLMTPDGKMVQEPSTRSEK